MRKILQQLNEEIGIKGSMLFGEDGLVVVAEQLGAELDGEVVAAVASKAITSTKRALTLLGQDKFDRFILISAYGRMVFVDINKVCLLVVTEKYINIDATRLGIESAARRIRSMLES